MTDTSKTGIGFSINAPRVFQMLADEFGCGPHLAVALSLMMRVAERAVELEDEELLGLMERLGLIEYDRRTGKPPPRHDDDLGGRDG